LTDVVCWPNKVVPSEPKISVHLAGKGKHLVRTEKLKAEKKRRLTTFGIKLLTYTLATMGMFLFFAGSVFLWQVYTRWLVNPITTYGSLHAVWNHDFWNYMLNNITEIAQRIWLPAGMMLIFLVLILFVRGLGGLGGGKSIGGAQRTEAPKLIVDNSGKVAPFIDATGHGSAQLFGSIAWDPLQTGGLGTPEHQRTSAGDVHRAHLGILYIDEIKNLQPAEAITLLTVLEDGQLPITLRSWRGGGSGTTAMAISTEAVPSMDFLVGAGNFDSIGQIHPALMDRIYGYGKVVRMNNDMPSTVENCRRYVQFIAQEVKRFHLIPFSREACEEIIAEGRRRSGKRDKLTTKFRPMIAIIKTAATLAMNDGLKVVGKKHVKEAIDEHCKTIQKQLLEHQMEERGKLLEIKPEGKELGQIYGLAVIQDQYSGEMTGNILAVKAFLEKKSKIERRTQKGIKGYFKVTGIAKPEKERWINDSVAKVRSVILRKYGVDIAQQYFTHIDFAQSYGVDGPSAGVTMTLLLCSVIEGKPIDQTVAVTGEINICTDDEIKITAIGGVHEKIKAAEAWGFKKVVIPKKNLEHSIDPSDYKIKVVGADNLDEYLKECLWQEGNQK